MEYEASLEKTTNTSATIQQPSENLFALEQFPSFLTNENLRLVIFGGKGGTGKTTSSCSTATYLAHMHPEKRFLVVSSDPAHSLADSLNCQVNDKITPVTGLNNLWAMEMDSQGILEIFKEKYKPYLENLSSMAYSSDQIDIRDFLTFKLPGMEEMMILLEIVRNLRFGIFRKWEFDTVIWDTAPTGHTLRLLELPDKLLEWISIFKMTSKRHRVIATGAATLGFKIRERRPPKGNVQKFIDKLAHDLEQLLDILRNPEQNEFVPVSIPEPMSILETEKLLTSLKEQGIAVRNVLINRISIYRNCPLCKNREENHKVGLEDIQTKFKDYNIIYVPVFAKEVRGEKTLLNYIAAMLGEYVHDYAEDIGKNGQLSASTVKELFPKATMKPLMDKDLQFLIFGGKGGVGKTTVSAATAQALALRYPEKRILVFSTDPAHSLSDSFIQPIGENITSIKGIKNLFALELNGTHLYEEFRTEYKVSIEKAFNVWKENNVLSTRKWKLDFDRNVMSKFVDTYPPGLEEVLALENIMESVNNNEYDIYVFDTAPTGHLLQLLQFPELVREWLRVSYKAILKYHREFPVDELEIIARKIISSQNTIVKMKSLLTNPEISEFVAVTIPEAMGLLETEDLTGAIKKLGIPNSRIIVNMIVPPTNCGFCMVKSKEQFGYVNQLEKKMNSNNLNITRIPLFPHDVRGIEKLNEVGNMMFEQEPKKA
ncbi:MAG: ArsA family ATPase [Bacteroidetes bacterium]|nr:ArsA family ATPase [Bacteroidota bacterium]